MTNYYEILGVEPSASHTEIKTAFRRLAKVYHPDKNASGNERFALILKAYETLSDPSLRSSYDYKIKYHQQQVDNPQSKNTGKTWHFDDKELKRRKYYDEYIRKHAPPTAAAPPPHPKNTYNEYKYILFATPLAVCLVLFIIYIASPGKPVNQSNLAPAESVSPSPQLTQSQLENGDSPYAVHFGNAHYDTKNNKTLVVKNLTGADIVICFFSKENFIRSFFMKSDFSVEVPQLPSDLLHIRYTKGLCFDKTCRLKQTEVQGAFTKELAYYKTINPAAVNELEVLTLLPGTNEGFEQTDERDFFRKQD